MRNHHTINWRPCHFKYFENHYHHHHHFTNQPLFLMNLYCDCTHPTLPRIKKVRTACFFYSSKNSLYHSNCFCLFMICIGWFNWNENHSNLLNQQRKNVRQSVCLYPRKFNSALFSPPVSLLVIWNSNSNLNLNF